MENLVKNSRSFLKRHPSGISLLVGLIYFFVIFYYMTPQILNPMSTLYGFGDSTAGAVWRYEVSPNNPFWGYQDMTNYPIGEDISSPVHASGTLQYLPYWMASKVVGPVAAYNLLNIVGLLFSAMMMYGLMLYVLKNRWIAIFAGYAVAFTPYYQMKIGGHPTYAFQGILIGVIWLFFRVIEYRRKRDAVMLGALTASTAYFDIYFTLLVAIILAALGGVWGVSRAYSYYQLRHSRKTNSTKKKIIIQEAKRLALAAGIAILIALPISLFFMFNQQQITGDVAAARGNVLAEAKACSNWPHEYLVPFVLHPIFERLIGVDRYQSAVNALRENLSCGIGEDSVGISIVLSLILFFAVAVIIWEALNRRPIKWGITIKTSHPIFILIGLSTILIVAVLMALPPLKYHNVIPTPSYELLSITTIWRTIGRIYVVVNIAFISMAAIMLAYFWESLKKQRWMILVFLLIIGGVAVEYQAFKPFTGNKLSNFSYKDDAPQVYTWLRDQKDITAVAEYPLEIEGKESDAGSYYLTMQSLHKKKLFNSALSVSSQDELRSGMKNLADPQTLPVLRAMGVNTVIAHGITAPEIAKLNDVDILYQAPQARFSLLSHTPTVKNDTTVVIGLDRVTPANSVITLGSGFVRNTRIINSVINWQYEAVNGSVLKVSGIKEKKISSENQPRSICFAARMSVPEETTELYVEVDGKTKFSLGEISGLGQNQYKVRAEKTVKLLPENGHNMQITQLGCSNE